MLLSNAGGLRVKILGPGKEGLNLSKNGRDSLATYPKAAHWLVRTITRKTDKSLKRRIAVKTRVSRKR